MEMGPEKQCEPEKGPRLGSINAPKIRKKEKKAEKACRDPSRIPVLLSGADGERSEAHQPVSYRGEEKCCLLKK
jgi:hypothetical protein